MQFLFFVNCSFVIINRTIFFEKVTEEGLHDASY